jgi:hypothetical protein
MENDDYYDLKIILWLILFLVFGIIIIACKPQTGSYIMTVNGLAPSNDIELVSEPRNL